MSNFILRFSVNFFFRGSAWTRRNRKKHTDEKIRRTNTLHWFTREITTTPYDEIEIGFDYFFFLLFIITNLESINLREFVCAESKCKLVYVASHTSLALVVLFFHTLFYRFIVIECFFQNSFSSKKKYISNFCISFFRVLSQTASAEANTQ